MKRSVERKYNKLTYIITLQATVEVEASSEIEALRNYDLYDAEVDKILFVECADDED